MAKLPTVAIIGRPNTGKSTLFNRFVGRRQAIVSDTAGTTRDHVVQRIETPEMDYLLLDTGGIGGGSEDKDFERDVSMQSKIALESADLILFTVNGQEDLTASDFNVADLLRKSRRAHVPVILVVTKADNEKVIEQNLPAYYELGVGDDVIPVSAVHRTGIDELETKIIGELRKMHFEKVVEDADSERPPRVAIIGKPNVGKSSLVNAFMSDPQRALSSRIVSPIPGTTRDSSDSIIKFEGKEFIFVDTAGLRRKSKVDEDLEYLGNVKSIQAMEDSDVTVLVMEAKEIVSKQEKRIANMAIEAGKGLILLINKSDMLTAEERKEKELEVRGALGYCAFAPLLFVSATNRDNLLKIFPLIESVHRNRLRRIPTKELLRWHESAVVHVPNPTIARSKFVTQGKEVPPTFVLFVRNPKKVQTSELRYLERNLRETFAFEGTPIRWITKEG